MEKKEIKVDLNSPDIVSYRIDPVALAESLSALEVLDRFMRFQNTGIQIYEGAFTKHGQENKVRINIDNNTISLNDERVTLIDVIEFMTERDFVDVMRDAFGPKIVKFAWWLMFKDGTIAIKDGEKWYTFH